jgi:hypothetical protein
MSRRWLLIGVAAALVVTAVTVALVHDWGGSGGRVHVSGYRVSEDGRQLRLVVGIGPCDTITHTSVEETSTTVRVSVTVRGLGFDERTDEPACHQQVAVDREVPLDLGSPLGDRTVVDDFTTVVLLK